MDTINIHEKACTKCKAIKPFSEFYKNRSKKDGLDGQCRKCCLARNVRCYAKETETRSSSQFFTSQEVANEEWRTVPGFEKYKVSSLGRIETTHSKRIEYSPPRILNQRKPGPNGYILYALSGDHGISSRTLHSIVLESFVGPCPEGMEACHENGIRCDCRLVNLRWDTRKANHQDSVRHGTHNTSGLELGRKPRLFKYTAAQLQWVLDNQASYSKRELSTQSGVHLSTVKRVLQGRFSPATLRTMTEHQDS